MKRTAKICVNIALIALLICGFGGNVESQDSTATVVKKKIESYDVLRPAFVAKQEDDEAAEGESVDGATEVATAGTESGIREPAAEPSPAKPAEATTDMETPRVAESMDRASETAEEGVAPVEAVAEAKAPERAEGAPRETARAEAPTRTLDDDSQAGEVTPTEGEPAAVTDIPTSVEILEATDERSEETVLAMLERKKDPFTPLFETAKPERDPKPQPVPPPVEKPDLEPEKPKRPLTPLERLDLGQLKLVGIVRAGGSVKALVEEATGKGYIITEGTPIGLNSGQVVEILEDRIVIEEKDRDPMGEVTVRTRELKFQRPEEYYEM